jgi:hypothetical protein
MVCSSCFYGIGPQEPITATETNTLTRLTRGNDGDDNNEAYDTLKQHILNGFVNISNVKATLYAVSYGVASYRFMLDDRRYEIYAKDFCRCGKDKCLSADHEHNLEYFF